MTNVTQFITLGNIKILGQYKVKLLEPDTIGGCLTRTLCRPCQRDSQYYLTLTNQCILFSGD